MYIYNSCLQHFDTLKRDIITTRSSVLFHSYTILSRFRHYSDSLSFHSFKRHSLSQSRLTPPFMPHPLYESRPAYSNLPLRHLLSTQQPSTRGFTFTPHLSYSSSGFRFYISDSFQCSRFSLRHSSRSSRVRALES